MHLHRTLIAALLLAACTPESGGPARPDAGSPPDAGPIPMSCDDESIAIARVLRPRCGDADCHDEDRPKAELDLVSPGIDSRVIGSRSIHDACAERQLVVPGVPQASFLFDKVLALEGECGDPMPLDTELTLEERRCLVEWIGAM